MSGDVPEDLKEQIVEFFKKKGKMMTHRDVAKGLGISTRVAKKTLTELINAGTLEFTSYGGATFIKLPDEE
jgi:Mn-dependent DtxR family transcriptional regulator